MDWLKDHPEVKTIRVAAPDLNGVARGKRIPARFAGKLLTEGTKFPYSVLNMDIWGEDVENSPLVWQAGDPDGLLMPTERGFMPMPWLDAPTGLLPLWMFHPDGRPYDGCPRQALARVMDRYKAAGLTPVVATELEFFLIDDSKFGELQVPPSPRSGKRRTGAETLSLRALDAFDKFFTDLYDSCEAMDIPADTAISEAAPGQFEINLMHQADPLKAADDSWLFKQLVKGLARRYGFAGSFMAKPYHLFNGSGMHVHFSILDADGKNIFDDGTDAGSDRLRHAVAGCLQAMPGSTLIFAPHENSYDRLVPNAHAPTGIGWAYENRTSAIRIPSSGHQARRIEHRTPGGDVNPYLMAAAVLGAALNGIEDGVDPPAALSGNAYEHDLAQLPGSWGEAIDAFEQSPEIRRIFSDHLIENFVMIKRQELHYMAELSDEETVELYLDTV